MPKYIISKVIWCYIAFMTSSKRQHFKLKIAQISNSHALLNEMAYLRFSYSFFLSGYSTHLRSINDTA